MLADASAPLEFCSRHLRGFHPPILSVVADHPPPTAPRPLSPLVYIIPQIHCLLSVRISPRPYARTHFSSRRKRDSYGERPHRCAHEASCYAAPLLLFFHPAHHLALLRARSQAASSHHVRFASLLHVIVHPGRRPIWAANTLVAETRTRGRRNCICYASHRQQPQPMRKAYLPLAVFRTLPASIV